MTQRAAPMGALGGRMCYQGPWTNLVRKLEASRGHPKAVSRGWLEPGPSGSLLCAAAGTQQNPGLFPGLGAFPWERLARQPHAGRCAPSISMAPITMAPTCSEKHRLKTEHKEKGGNPLPCSHLLPQLLLYLLIAHVDLAHSQFPCFCCSWP